MLHFSLQDYESDGTDIAESIGTMYGAYGRGSGAPTPTPVSSQRAEKDLDGPGMACDCEEKRGRYGYCRSELRCFCQATAGGLLGWFRVLLSVACYVRSLLLQSLGELIWKAGYLSACFVYAEFLVGIFPRQSR